MGTIPRNMTAVLEYDLVDTCKAGDDVTIFGIVTQIWDTPVTNTRCSVETVLHANYIQIHNEQRCNLDVTDNAISQHYAHWRRYKDRPMSGRNLLLASFCPDVYQLYIVKLAAFLVILGGVTHMDGRGSKVRGECHMLMVGDPGTGKSQILKYASKLSPRSVITTGIGCTKAGLTVAAVKEGGEWALEAGAMVLADGGVCCIDELSSIRETDRVAIHEAMEQQTISVAKAGLVCKLNTRTTVLAATNPRGSYDITQPISANVPIGTPLLSRFDLILVLFDDHTPTWDSLVAGYLLKEQAVIEENNILKNYTADTLWSFTELQQYVSHVKSLTPKLTKPAKEVLGRYYRLQREQISRNVSRTTIRMLESLVRLSQAHAKLMMHERVELEDAIVTISLVECTMLNSSLLGSVSVLHSVFPAQPELEFNKQKTLVLEVLGLPPNYGESNEPAPQTIAPTRRRGPVLETDDLVEVPSFHVNTQELRKELDRQEKKRAPIPTQSLINGDTNPESKVPQKIVHKQKFMMRIQCSSSIEFEVEPWKRKTAGHLKFLNEGLGHGQDLS
ncbi:DNA helicase MCM9-like [Bolinopsis microptera]|uniref:DNA helicase MCM9-like n=1 Tax=Bolinopsis microptera TaxID=2820187 RepID=UPI00307A3973